MRLRCSAMERAMHCLYWAHRSVEVLPSKAGYPAYVGNAVHSIIAETVLLSRGAELDVSGTIKTLIAKYPAKTAARLESYQIPQAVRASLMAHGIEMELSWDSLTDKCTRQYISDDPDTIPGKLDVVYQSGHDQLWTYRDWKTSSIDEAWRYIGQMEYGAFLVARYFDVWTVASELVFLAKARYVPYRRVLREEELVTLGAEYRHMLDVLKMELPPLPQPGRWCKYCEAKCPHVQGEEEKEIDQDLPYTKEQETLNTFQKGVRK